MRRTILEIITLFVGVTAILGGIGLITGLIQPPERLLQGSPFSDYLIPGLILAFITGGSALISFWALSHRSRNAALLTYVAGLILCGWVIIEIAFIHEVNWLQYIYVFLATLLLAGSYSDMKRTLITR